MWHRPSTNSVIAWNGISETENDINMGSMLYHAGATLMASFGIVYLAFRIFDTIKGGEKEGFRRHKIIYFILLIIILLEMVHEKVGRIIEYYAG